MLLKSSLESLKDLRTDCVCANVQNREGIILISLTANLTRDEEIGLYRRTGQTNTRKRGVTAGESEKKPISPVSKATSWMRKPRGRVSYSRIIFTTLESHRDAPFSLFLFLPFSVFFLLVHRRSSSLPLSIYFRDADVVRYSFVYRAVQRHRSSLRPIPAFP